ncbi:MAG TPA: cytochrome c family protein [Rhizomicrobium sp.]|jgi:cytochrome c|nr:cytochrome c family protein [Rhizomicrobium sp.]
MDSFEWNKILGAVLGTVMFVLVVRFTTEAIFEPEMPAKPGYVVEGVEEATAGGAAAAPVEEAMPDWGTVLPTADVNAGKAIVTRCEQCHDLTKGGPNKIGPNLWNVVGRARGEHPGFSYSSAMTSDHSAWDYEKLFKFLKMPAAYVPGTKMSFAGLRSATDRVNLLAYLRTQADSPLAIPAPNPAAAAKPAEGAAAPAAGGAAAPAAGGAAKPAEAPAAPAEKKPG